VMHYLRFFPPSRPSSNVARRDTVSLLHRSWLKAHAFHTNITARFRHLLSSSHTVVTLCRHLCPAKSFRTAVQRAYRFLLSRPRAVLQKGPACSSTHFRYGSEPLRERCLGLHPRPVDVHGIVTERILNAQHVMPNTAKDLQYVFKMRRVACLKLRDTLIKRHYWLTFVPQYFLSELLGPSRLKFCMKRDLWNLTGPLPCEAVRRFYDFAEAYDILLLCPMMT